MVLILAKCEVIIILAVIIDVRFLLLVVIDAGQCQLAQLQVMVYSVSTSCEVF